MHFWYLYFLGNHKKSLTLCVYEITVYIHMSIVHDSMFKYSTQEFLIAKFGENLEELFPLCYMHSDLCNSSQHSKLRYEALWIHKCNQRKEVLSNLGSVIWGRMKMLYAHKPVYMCVSIYTKHDNNHYYTQIFFIKLKK